MPHAARDELTSVEREILRGAVAADGQIAVARWCGVSRQSLLAAIAGAPVRRGTLTLIRRRTTERATSRPSQPDGPRAT